ncbi:hypothetical protein [Halopseudomonas pertucinogena]|uniref:Uncharacterized protein n=1 Tax=Halopseudomonas pertucinogena TaxID=86175 RepID=A0ABQ2CRY9_9GAMM|nr:hypothetical protein [Halopseudomonas pertucinogena]GGJ06297.1 hypothetical protein GCM10009083_24070 [Halopseudomonas pertucinogena]
MYSHVQNAIALRSAQLAYDNMLPPEDPPEEPDFYFEEIDLLNGQDTDLVRYEQFKQVASERIYDLVDSEVVFEFLRQCSVSLDLNTRDAAKPFRKALEQIAGETLGEAWKADMKKEGRL